VELFRVSWIHEEVPSYCFIAFADGGPEASAANAGAFSSGRVSSRATKMRQNRKLELSSDSVGGEKALGRNAEK
jgi:hypothetical protein